MSGGQTKIVLWIKTSYILHQKLIYNWFGLLGNLNYRTYLGIKPSSYTLTSMHLTSMHLTAMHTQNISVEHRSWLKIKLT